MSETPGKLPPTEKAVVYLLDDAIATGKKIAELRETVESIKLVTSELLGQLESRIVRLEERLTAMEGASGK